MVYVNTHDLADHSTHVDDEDKQLLETAGIRNNPLKW